MAWIIIKDFITDGKARIGTNANAVGIKGGRGWTKGVTGDEPKFQYKFRMYDDDGILYYEGFNTEPNDPHPMEAFGGPNAGCTTIAYRDKKGLYRKL